MDKEKDLEKLMDKIFEGDSLEVPSSDFTRNVIQKVEERTKEKLTYTPLLPKWLLQTLVVSAVIFVVYVFMNSDFANSETSYFDKLNFSTTWLTEGLSQLNLSTILGYAILCMGLLICLQASLLNKFLNRSNSIA